MACSPAAHRYWTAYERQGRHAAACLVSAAGVAGRPRLARGRADSKITGNEGIGVTQPAHRDRLDGPWTEAGQRGQSGPGLRPVAAGAQVHRSAGQRRRQRGEGGPAGAGQGQRGRVDRGQRGRAGEQPGQAARGIVHRLAVRRGQPARMRPGRRGRHLLAEHRADGEFRRVDGARHPAAGGLGHQRGEHRIAAEQITDRHRVGIQVQQPPAPADRDGQVPQVGQGQLAGDVLGPGPQADDAMGVRQPQRPPVAAVPPFLHPGHRGRGEMAEQVVRAERQPERQPERQHAGGGGRLPAAGPAAQLGRGQREHLAHGVVEGPDAGEAGREGHIGHRQRARLDQQPRRLRPLRPGQRQRPGTEFGPQLAFHLADAVAEPGGQPRHAAGIDDPVGDQPHGPGDQVRALVPQRGPGGGVRPAPLAGPEAGLLRGRRTRIEPHVLRLGRHHRAARPAVDPGGDDSRVEPAVEAGVLRLDGPHAALGIVMHPPSIGPRDGPGLAKMRHGRGRGRAAGVMSQNRYPAGTITRVAPP